MNQHAFAAEHLKEGLGFLKTLGFAGPETQIEKSALLGEVLCLKFSSTRYDRLLTIRHSPGDEKAASVLTVLVSRPSTQGSFLLDHWAKQYHAVKALIGQAHIRSSDEEIAFVRAFCRDLESLCKGEFNAILTGAVWPSVEYDWGGYK